MMTKTSKMAKMSRGTPKTGKAIGRHEGRPDAPMPVAIPGDEIDRLDSMPLGELQRIFSQVTGEATRCPNKGYLVRSIREAIASKQTRASSGTDSHANSSTGSDENSPDSVDDQEADFEVLAASLEPGTAVDEPETANVLPVGEEPAELAAETVEPAATATLPTPSADASGASAVHPRHQKMGGELMVLPLRMKADVVDELDAAWHRQGFQSRMALLRHVLRSYFASVGEDDLAALLADKA